jgi:hypothetical protein
MLKIKKQTSVNFKVLVFLAVIFTQITSCGAFKKDDVDASDASESTKLWWQTKKPDFIINQNQYFLGTCAITQVNKNGDPKTEKVIFKAPYRLLASCHNDFRNGESLQYDGEYMILNVCQSTFAAGSCNFEQYRSADIEHWQEYIGVTWRKGEQYDAWRKLGSTSAKADYINKILKKS